MGGVRINGNYLYYNENRPILFTFINQCSHPSLWDFIWSLSFLYSSCISHLPTLMQRKLSQKPLSICKDLHRSTLCSKISIFSIQFSSILTIHFWSCLRLIWDVPQNESFGPAILSTLTLAGVLHPTVLQYLAIFLLVSCALSIYHPQSYNFPLNPLIFAGLC